MDKIAKFGLGDMLPIGITFAVVGIALAFALQVIGDVQDDMTASSAEANATGDAITGLSNITGKLPTIALVVVAALIIGILVRNFVTR